MADNSEEGQHTRTIIIPKDILSPDQVNILSIPRDQNSSAPLLVVPRRDGNGVSTRCLPIWNDELSDGDRDPTIRHLVGTPRACGSRMTPPNRAQSIRSQQTNHDFSLSSLYDSSAEMDEKDAMVFQNIMDGKYNVIKQMSPSPERIVPKLPEYRGGQGFRPRHLSTPAKNAQQLFMDDTEFPSTMYSKEFFTPDLAGVESSFDSTLPSRCQTYPPGKKSKSTGLPQDGGSHAGIFPPRDTSACPGSPQNAQFGATIEGFPNGPNATFGQPMATFHQPNATFGQTNSAAAQPVAMQSHSSPSARRRLDFDDNDDGQDYSSSPQSSLVPPSSGCGNYSAAPFGIPIDTKLPGPKLPYYPPPSHIQSFPGARGASRRSPQLGRSFNAITPAQTPDTSANLNYSAAPFGIPIDTKLDYTKLPYYSPPSQNQTFPRALRNQQKNSQLYRSVEGSLPRPNLASASSGCGNYSAAPFGIPIDTELPGPKLPYYPPPSHIQSFPGARGASRRSPQLGRSFNAITPAQTPDTSANLNYSAAPFGIPIDTKLDYTKLPYYSPPSQNQTFPGAVRNQQKNSQLYRSVEGSLPQPNLASASSGCGNYSAAPFGIPIDTELPGPKLPYYPPPSHIQSFPGARGASRSPRSFNAITPVQTPDISAHLNYSDAPSSISTDTTQDYTRLPYYSPPSQNQTFPGAVRNQRIKSQLCRSVEGSLPQPKFASASSSRGNYSDAPLGIPIDTEFNDEYLPYYPPPSHNQTFPGAVRHQNRIQKNQRLGSSLNECGPDPRDACGNANKRTPRIGLMSSWSSSRLDNSTLGRSVNSISAIQTPDTSAHQNYSDAPFGLPLDDEYSDAYLPYESPPRHNQTYPGAVRDQNRPQNNQRLSSSLNECGSNPRNVCTNDDERTPRIMHMSSRSFSRFDNSPLETNSIMLEAPGGVSVELMNQIVQENSGSSYYEPSPTSIPDSTFDELDCSRNVSCNPMAVNETY